jgi:hypothetical protein
VGIIGHIAQSNTLKLIFDDSMRDRFFIMFNENWKHFELNDFRRFIYSAINFRISKNTDLYRAFNAAYKDRMLQEFDKNSDIVDVVPVYRI